MREIWKDIPGFEGIYQVSNTGLVRSLNFNLILQEVSRLFRREYVHRIYCKLSIANACGKSHRDNR